MIITVPVRYRFKGGSDATYVYIAVEDKPRDSLTLVMREYNNDIVHDATTLTREIFRDADGGYLLLANQERMDLLSVMQSTQHLSSDVGRTAVEMFRHHQREGAKDVADQAHIPYESTPEEARQRIMTAAQDVYSGTVMIDGRLAVKIERPGLSAGNLVDRECRSLTIKITPRGMENSRSWPFYFPSLNQRDYANKLQSREGLWLVKRRLNLEVLDDALLQEYQPDALQPD